MKRFLFLVFWPNLAKKYLRQEQSPAREQMFEDVLSTMNKIETALRRRLPSLQKDMKEAIPDHLLDLIEKEEEEEDDMTY